MLLIKAIKQPRTGWRLHLVRFHLYNFLPDALLIVVDFVVVVCLKIRSRGNFVSLFCVYSSILPTIIIILDYTHMWETNNWRRWKLSTLYEITSRFFCLDESLEIEAFWIIDEDRIISLNLIIEDVRSFIVNNLKSTWWCFFMRKLKWLLGSICTHVKLNWSVEFERFHLHCELQRKKIEIFSRWLVTLPFFFIHVL
jgi:hypothetical protein